MHVGKVRESRVTTVNGDGIPDSWSDMKSTVAKSKLHSRNSEIRRGETEKPGCSV